MNVNEKLVALKEQWMRGFLADGEVLDILRVHYPEAWFAYVKLASWNGACNKKTLEFVLDNGTEKALEEVEKLEKLMNEEFFNDFPTEEEYQEMRDFYGWDD